MYDLATIVFNGSRVEVPCDGWDYDLPDDTHTLISKWNLVCDREQYLVQSFAYYTVSGVLVPPLLGQMADRVGRRPVVITALPVAMGSVFVATAADSCTTFVLANLLIAISGAAVHIMTSILLFESSSSASRTLYIAAAQTAAFLVHAGSLCPWLQRVDLRLLRITLVMSMVLLSLTFHAASESPRWLLAVGKYDTLTAVIARLACETGVVLGDAWRLVHYAEVVKPLQVIMEVLFAVVQLCQLIAKLQAYECFPSAVRATGVTMLVAAGRLGQSVAEMLVDVARLADFWSTLLIIATGLLVCELAIRWLPETKAVELPEVQREVLAQGQQSPPKEPSMARHIESCAPSASHHDSTADNRRATKHTHSEGVN
ncbi:beta-alanine transporter-like [Amblyomma americanum]